MTPPNCGLRLLDDDPGSTLQLSGDWRLAGLHQVWPELQRVKLREPVTIDAHALTALDSAAALALLSALPRDGSVRWVGLADSHRRIVDAVAARARPAEAATHHAPGVLALLGRHAHELLGLLRGHVSFLGATVAALGEVAFAPRRLRLRELTSQFEHLFVNALPVVSLVTLLIGVTIAYLLGLQAEKYGANIFVVDGVGIGMTREFSPLLVAVIVAGRSGAAFTAQLGAMRLTEEIDAIRTLGLAPMQVLVVPRVLALTVSLPLMVFVGDVAGIAGAMLVAEPMLGITPPAFLDRLRESLDLVHVWVGLAKAPVFALAIGVIGCRMGMSVARDTRAVGLATTSTVVQSIVFVILLDAAFAALFQALDW